MTDFNDSLFLGDALVQSCAKVSPYVARKSRAELHEHLAYSAFRLFAG